MNVKRIINNILIFNITILILNLSVCINIASAKSFNDVPSGRWYSEAINYVTDKEIFSGVSTKENVFAPQGFMTRAMIVNAIYNMENRPKVTNKNTYTDVKEESWYSDAIAWANEIKIVNGFPDESFKPNENVTREMFAVIIKNYMTYKNEELKNKDITNISTLQLKDFDKISNWSKDSIKFCIYFNLINGDTNGNVNPKKNITRAEASSIIMRYYKEKDKFNQDKLIEPVEEKPIVEPVVEQPTSDIPKVEPQITEPQIVTINKKNLSGNALITGNLVSKNQIEGTVAEKISNTTNKITITSSNGEKFVLNDKIVVTYTAKEGYTFKDTDINNNSFTSVERFSISVKKVDKDTLEVTYTRSNDYNSMQNL